jgi:hypothetical protein
MLKVLPFAAVPIPAGVMSMCHPWRGAIGNTLRYSISKVGRACERLACFDPGDDTRTKPLALQPEGISQRG